MRLIDADDLPSDVMLHVGEDDDEFEFVYMYDIEHAPTIDAEPVRHGRWIDINGDGSLWRCSVCGELQCCESNYCGDCGARMDGDRDERTKRL